MKTAQRRLGRNSTLWQDERVVLVCIGQFWVVESAQITEAKVEWGRHIYYCNFMRPWPYWQ